LTKSLLTDKIEKTRRKAVKHMPVMDEFREEREALRNGTRKERFEYFWMYYKWYVIGGIAAVVFIVSFIYEIINNKDYAFYGVFLNSYALDGEEAYMQGFADRLDYDETKYTVGIDSSLYISHESYDETTTSSTQKLMVYIAANEIDLIVGDATTFNQYAYNETFADLRDILSEEQMEKYSDYFYYIDQATADEKEAAQDDMNYEYVPDYPDSTKPEEMETPIPVGVYIDSNESLWEAYSFSEESVVMGIVINTLRPEAAVEFLEYVFGY